MPLQHSADRGEFNPHLLNLLLLPILSWRHEPSRQAALGDHADLTCSLVDVDANMVHGWPLLLAPVSAFSLGGAFYATTLSGESAASSNLCSTVAATNRFICFIRFSFSFFSGSGRV